MSSKSLTCPVWWCSVETDTATAVLSKCSTVFFILNFYIWRWSFNSSVLLHLFFFLGGAAGGYFWQRSKGSLSHTLTHTTLHELSWGEMWHVERQDKITQGGAFQELFRHTHTRPWTEDKYNRQGVWLQTKLTSFLLTVNGNTLTCSSASFKVTFPLKKKHFL